MNKREQCSVYAGHGTLKGRRGLYRIIVMAPTKEAARDALETTDEVMVHYHVSRLTHEWTIFDDTTSIGDIFAAPLGTKNYEPVDGEDVEA